MPTRYFELTDDLHIPERWDLDTPVDARGQALRDALFTAGGRVECATPLRMPLRAYDGVALDFTEAGGGIPVVSERLAAVFSARAAGDVQLLPVEVEAHAEPFFVLVCTRRVEARERSGDEEDESFRSGAASSPGAPRLDEAWVGEAQVFRARGWETLLVTEALKEALEEVGGTGPRFWEVTSGPVTSAAGDARRRARARWEQADAARTAFWSTLGTEVERPRQLRETPGVWPGRRQAWRVLRRVEGRTLLVTDGLSDPFLERESPSVGFGLELALETDTELTRLHKSWPTQLLQRVGEELARSEAPREAARAGLVSLDVSGKRMPTSLVTQEGRVGVLLGVESEALPRGFSLPEGAVRLVTVKALLPAEWAYTQERGAEGREQLARHFVRSGEAHLSRARRRSVLSLLR